MRTQQQPSEGLEMGRDGDTKIQTEFEGWYKQPVFVAVKASREISEETARRLFIPKTLAVPTVHLASSAHIFGRA